MVLLLTFGQRKKDTKDKIHNLGKETSSRRKHTIMLKDGEQ
jgi:hypothetical protein